MTGTDILNSIWLNLGENTTFYPETEVMVNGINPAMRLIALMRPESLTQRVALTVLAEMSLIDLRQYAPRSWILRRVMLGTMTGDTPTRTDYGELRPLMRTSLSNLSWERNWFSKRGTPTEYYEHGRDWVGIYKRPTADRTMTLVFRAIPTAFTSETMTNSPDVADALHPLIADVATALLLMKEGAVQIDKARSMLMTAFGRELFGEVRQRIGVLARETPVHSVLPPMQPVPQ